MTLLQAIKSKFDGVPRDYDAALELLKTRCCALCGSRLLVAIHRHELVWNAHCNHCGSEVPFAVLLNQKAWRLTARIKLPASAE